MKGRSMHGQLLRAAVSVPRRMTAGLAACCVPDGIATLKTSGPFAADDHARKHNVNVADRILSGLRRVRTTAKLQAVLRAASGSIRAALMSTRMPSRC